MRKLADGIREKMYNYVEKSKLQSLVLGISGGIDSTLCAALLRPVCEKLNIPLLGIFGNDDRRPDVNEVNALEELLKKYGKEYEFCRYDGAGHGIWYYDKPMYRQEAAMDSFNKTLDFFAKYLK